MSYVPRPLTPDYTRYSSLPEPKSPRTITISALKENKRPIGFLPWPDEPEPEVPVKKRKKGKKP